MKQSGVRQSGVRVNYCGVALAGSILYKNWQRLGAVVNVTVREFDEAKVVFHGGKPNYILYVEHHRTALEGFAIVVLEPIDHARFSLFCRHGPTQRATLR